MPLPEQKRRDFFFNNAMKLYGWADRPGVLWLRGRRSGARVALGEGTG